MVLKALNGAEARCTGRGRCCFSGRPHDQLTGPHKGEFATERTNAYPAALCAALARHFCNQCKQKEASVVWAVMV